MLDTSMLAARTALFALPQDQIAIRDTARAFAADPLAPHALAWDGRKRVPGDMLRDAASL